MSNLPPFARFWMVCRKPQHAGAKTEPRQRYSSREDAQRTAERLARENDAPFIILEAVGIARPTDPDYSRGLF
ncbi:hypothetical protein [uncultured Roseobacter sp.]|uniref:hypothetical protein n=1 Tax=uncultured Roseobacter sp. TaxID=114847 RepID=UPI0026024158|nr:hypothetical protein [uncultured Roseobacter sp.]